MAAPRFVPGDAFKVPMAIKKMERYSDKLKGPGKLAVKLNSVNYEGDETTVRLTSSDGEKIILPMTRMDAAKLLEKTDKKAVPNFSIKYVMYDGKRMTKDAATKLKARNKQMGIKPSRARLSPVRPPSANSNNEVNEVPKPRPPKPTRPPTGPNPLQIAAQKVNELLDISMLKGLKALAFVEILKKLKKPTNLRNLVNETKKKAEKMLENANDIEFEADLEAAMNYNEMSGNGSVINKSGNKLKNKAAKLRAEAARLQGVNAEIYSVGPFEVISSIPTLPKSVTISMINLLMRKRDGKGGPQLTGLAREIAVATISLIQAHHKEQRDLENADKRKVVVFDNTKKTNTADTKKTKKSTKPKRKTNKTNYKAPSKLPRPKIGLPSGQKRTQHGKRAPPVDRAMNQKINDSEWIPSINEDPSFETYAPKSTPGKPSPSKSPNMGYMVINDESILRVIRKRLLARLDEINEIERYIRPYDDVFQASLYVNTYIMNGLAEDDRVSGLLDRAIKFLKRSGTHGGGLIARGLKQNKSIKGGEQITGLKTANFSVQLKSVIAETKGGQGESLTYARTWLNRFGTRELRMGVGNNQTVRDIADNENVNGEWVIGNTGTPEYRPDPFRNEKTESRSIHETVLGMEFHPLWVVRGALGYRAWERVKDKPNTNPEKKKLQTMIPVHPLCNNPWTTLRSRISEKDKVRYQGTEYTVSGIKFVQSGKKREPIFELKTGNTRISNVRKSQIVKVHGIVKGDYAMLKEENNEPVIIRNITGGTAKVSLKSGKGFQFNKTSVQLDVNKLREMDDSDFAKLSDEFKSVCKQKQKVSKIKEKVLFHGFCARPQDANACSVNVPTDITSWLRYMTVFARNLVSTEVTNMNNTIDKSSATTIERVACKSYKDCEIKCKKQGKVQCRGLAAIVNDEIENPFDSNDFGSVENIKNDLQKRVNQIKLTFKPKNTEKILKDLKLKVKKLLIDCNRATLRMLYYKSLPHVKNITQSEKDLITQIETQRYNGQPVLSAEEISNIKRRLENTDWTKRLDPQRIYREEERSACKDYQKARYELKQMEGMMERRNEQFLKLQNKLDHQTKLLTMQKNDASGSNTQVVTQPQQALALVRATDVIDQTTLRAMDRSSANAAVAVFDWNRECKRYKNQPTCDRVPQCIWIRTISNGYCRKRVRANDDFMTLKETERYQVILKNLKKILKDYPRALQNVSKVLTTRRLKSDERILQRAKRINYEVLKTRPELIKNAIDRSVQGNSRLRQVLQNALAQKFTAGFVNVTSCAKKHNVINEKDNTQVAVSQISTNPLEIKKYEAQIKTLNGKITQSKATLFKLHSDKAEQQDATKISEIEEQIKQIKIKQAKFLSKKDFFEKKLRDNSLRVVNLVASARKWKDKSNGETNSTFVPLPHFVQKFEKDPFLNEILIEVQQTKVLPSSRLATYAPSRPSVKAISPMSNFSSTSPSPAKSKSSSKSSSKSISKSSSKSGSKSNKKNPKFAPPAQYGNAERRLRDELAKGNLNQLFETAEALGSNNTTFGLTRLRKDARLVIKKFKGSMAEQFKKQEETTHLKLWDSLDNACRQHICEPIRTTHPVISLQVYPAKDTGTLKQTSMTLADFGKLLNAKKLKLNERLAKFMGSDDPHSIVKRQLIQALKCLHMKGFAHQDIKPDNMLVIFQLQNQKISYLKVKLIDFGITRYSADGKPLVKLTDDFKNMNITKLNALLRNRPDKYSNRYLFMKTKNLPRMDRPYYVKTAFLPKYLGQDFREVYRRELKRNAIRTQKIRKRVQDDPYKALKKIRNKVKAK